MTDKEKARAYDEALDRCKEWASGTCEQSVNNSPKDVSEFIFPQLAESEDEKIRKHLIEIVETYWGTTNDPGKAADLAYLEKQKDASKAIEVVERIDKYIDEYLANAHDMKDSNPDKRYYQGWDDALGKMVGILQDVYSDERQKEQKPIKMEVYEVGKGTTVCGQDYKCKKDYKAGNCLYIKDALYHCGRDGYLTDQNGVSWSCTPEWFKEYIQSNTEWAEEEKTSFVSRQFLQCKLSFDEFKEGEHYWLEYIGDDMYVGRSDNILNQKFHITPRQLYTLFSQQLEEKQKEQKPVEWSKEDKSFYDSIMCEVVKEGMHPTPEQANWLKLLSERFVLQPKQKWSKEDERILKGIIGLIDHDQHYGVSNNEMISWLKSLRPQQKVEWSEKDKKMLWIIQLALTKHPITDKQEKDAFDWLNSLRPQPQAKTNDYITPHKKFFKWIYNRLIDVHNENPNVDYMRSFKERIDNLQFDEPHWKPSDEQLRPLEYAIDYFKKKKNDTTYLESLYNDLKKLM